MAKRQTKTNMEILNEIRDSRNKVLEDIGRNDTVVTKVMFLGKGENTNKTYFMHVEEKEIINPRTGEVERDSETNEPKKEIWYFFYEYDKTPILIGVRNPNTEEQIIPIGFDGNEQLSWEDEKEDIQNLEKQQDLKAIAEKLGINEEQIQSLSEIELAQLVEENHPEEKNEENNEELSRDEVEKIGITGINEINLNAQVDSKGTTLGSTLKLDGYSKIMVVHSYKLANIVDAQGNNRRINNMKFGIVAQKADGTYELIPETKLKPYRGQNREVTEIDNVEDVNTKNEDCIFEVPGSNKKLVIDQKDPYGIPYVYLSQNTRNNDGNMAQKIQDKYDGTTRQDIEVRALFNANKGINQADKMRDEIKEHIEAGCKDLDIEEINGDPNDGHIHFNPDNVEHQKAINEIMEKGKVSKEEAQAKLIHEIEQNEDITLEEAKENTIEQIEEEYKGIGSRDL